MAAAWQSTSPSTSTITTGTSSVALSAPSGIANGDGMLAIVTDHATSGTSAAPTGWTNQGGIASSAGRLQVFSGIYGKNSIGAGPWTFSGLTSRSGGCILRFTGIDNATPADVAVSGRQNASGTTGTTSITPVSANALIAAVFSANASGSTWSNQAVATNPGALTEHEDGANSSYCSISVATALQSGAGAATGASSATMGTAGTNGALLIALRPALAPTVTTQAVSSIASTTATGNGNVTADGGNDITERGVCWSTSSGPTTANSNASASGTTGAYTVSMTALSPGTHYYARAYAINAQGTSYGSEVQFDTHAAGAGALLLTGVGA